MKTTFKQEKPPKEFIPITISFTIENERELRAWTVFNDSSSQEFAQFLNGERKRVDASIRPFTTNEIGSAFPGIDAIDEAYNNHFASHNIPF